MILLKNCFLNRQKNKDPKEVFDKDKNDWCIVEITMEALKIILGEN